jgi:hypothetical protein
MPLHRSHSTFYHQYNDTLWAGRLWIQRKGGGNLESFGAAPWCDRFIACSQSLATYACFSWPTLTTIKRRSTYNSYHQLLLVAVSKSMQQLCSCTHWMKLYTHTSSLSYTSYIRVRGAIAALRRAPPRCCSSITYGRRWCWFQPRWI